MAKKTKTTAKKRINEKWLTVGQCVRFFDRNGATRFGMIESVINGTGYEVETASGEVFRVAKADVR